MILILRIIYSNFSKVPLVLCIIVRFILIFDINNSTYFHSYAKIVCCVVYFDANSYFKCDTDLSWTNFAIVHFIDDSFFIVIIRFYDVDLTFLWVYTFIFEYCSFFRVSPWDVTLGLEPCLTFLNFSVTLCTTVSIFYQDFHSIT